MLKKKWFKFFVVVFVFLTIIKLFTAKVGLLGDSTVQLVMKLNPTISNEFIMEGEESESNVLKYKGMWFFEKKYRVIYGDEIWFSGEKLYDVMILSWWFLSIVMILFLIGNYINNKVINIFTNIERYKQRCSIGS